jgi:hypothetical protein
MYYEKVLKANQSNLKKTWKILKKAANIKSKGTEQPQCFIVNGVTISDPTEMANSLNEFFACMPSDIVRDILPTEEVHISEPSPNSPTLNFADTPLTNCELLDAIAQLKPKTSTDFNNLSMYFVKKIFPQIQVPLKHVLSLSLNTGVVPSQFKIAKITPVFKSGDKSNMDNYRPISLLSCFSKICEKIVANRLISFIDMQNLLSNNQFGFRKNHSTLHPMLKFTNFISNALNKKEHAIAIFCDLRKAFDCVDHKILLKKLKKIGISGTALSWFTDYLQNRKQFVVINGKTSSLCNIRIGVPQGSILGPLLFLLYINDLPDCSLLLSIMFADDTTTCASGPDINTLVDFVNCEFQKITTYFRAHKMALHPSKTKFILFTNSKPIEDRDIQIMLNNNNAGENFADRISRIERVTTASSTPAMKFLGVYFDPKLNFKFHVKQLVSKLSRALFILRSVKTILSPAALRTIYFSVFHCHIIYAIQLWSCTNDGSLKVIFLKQKQAIRVINNSKYNEHTEPLFKKSAILPFFDLALFFKLQVIQQYSQGFLPLAINGTWKKNSERILEHHDEEEGGVARGLRVLRNEDDFYVPFSRLVSIDKLPLISFPTIWNNFHEHDLKLVRNKLQFNSKLKLHFLNKLKDIVSCDRLLCQACHPF